MSGDIFSCYNRGEGGDAIGIKWVEARDAAKQPTIPRTALTTNDYLAQNVSSAQTENHVQITLHMAY